MPHSEIIPYGQCHCGCGGAAPIAKQTDTKRGSIKGQPRKYILGHSGYNPQIPEQAVPFRLDGVYCRLIPLTQGQFAIVDEEDYWELAKHKWFAFRSRHGRCYYAARHSGRVNGKQGPAIWMHRHILGLAPDDSREGDHADVLNSLNNSRKNLRIATRSQQVMNQRRNSRNTSGYKGVSWSWNMEMWRTEIMVDGVKYFLGYTNRAYEGHLLYVGASARLHGKFGRTE